MSQQKSLQRELYRWIIISALILVVLSSAIAGILAFKQAKELQDNTLKEISFLVNNGQLNFSDIDDGFDGSFEKDDDDYEEGYRKDRRKKNKRRFKKYDDDDDEETSIIIHEIGRGKRLPGIPPHIKDGLQTIDLKHDEWRVLTITQSDGRRRFSIAQPTELRDQIALSSAISTLIPILFLVTILLVAIHLILRRQFRSLNLLAKSIDQQDGTQLKKLSEKNIPLEIIPFIGSINSLISRVQQVMQKQQRFIADAAHELRTPITALSLQAENLKESKSASDREARELQLQSGFDRLGKLVAQLLDLARLQSSADVENKTVSFNEVVKHAIADLYPLAEAADIDFGMLRHDNDLNITDQNGRLGQLVNNAIGNAIHYTPAQGKVDVSLFKENGKAVLLVEDTGIGIPEDELQKVMEPFHRVLESGKPGNGLGLAICHEIAERLNGEISLSNRKDGGLRFRYEQQLTNK